MTVLDRFLRRTLAVDALTCVAAGAVMVFGAGVLAPLTGLSQGLLLGAGIALFPVAALMAWLSRRAEAPAALLWLVVIGNIGWAVGSAAVLFLTRPTPFGYVFVIAQAATVVVLTMLEYRSVAAGRLATA